MKKYILLTIAILLLVAFYPYSNGFRQTGEASIIYIKNQHKETLQSLINIQKDTNFRKFKSLELVRKIQSFNSRLELPSNLYDEAINSPKSAIFNLTGDKFYINSLEGYTTVVYNSKSFEKLKEIKHHFNEYNAHLFKDNETTVFDYEYHQNPTNKNYFKGKPVESCLSHNGRYLWTTYYRRDFDTTASSPSAIAIIDTEKDEIVRVMPSGPLPKMVACSNDNKFIAVTHWGDNTVALIDIKSDNVLDFKYICNIPIDGKMTLRFSEKVDRDNNCGNCLRGTVFTPDNKYLLVAKMGGNGIALIDLESKKYKGTITGSKLNLRHLIISKGYLYASSNKFGSIESMPLSFIDTISKLSLSKNIFDYTRWTSVFVGLGARTIESTPDGRYIIACVNNESKITVIDVQQMKVVFEINTDKFPVGLAISPDGNYAIVTSQGKESVKPSGNAVNIYKINYD